MSTVPVNFSNQTSPNVRFGMYDAINGTVLPVSVDGNAAVLRTGVKTGVYMVGAWYEDSRGIMVPDNHPAFMANATLMEGQEYQIALKNKGIYVVNQRVTG